MMRWATISAPPQPPATSWNTMRRKTKAVAALMVVPPVAAVSSK